MSYVRRSAIALVAVVIPVSSLAQVGERQTAVLVTGASSGIGRKITERLAERGFFVYAGARSQADLADLAKLKNVQPLRLDVTVASTASKRTATAWPPSSRVSACTSA